MPVSLLVSIQGVKCPAASGLQDRLARGNKRISITRNLPRSSAVDRRCRRGGRYGAVIVNARERESEEGSGKSSFLDTILQNSPFAGGNAGVENSGALGFLSGTMKMGGNADRKDPNTVFVAGSTGRLGLRIVHQLAAAGFKVRAGVRSQDKADNFEELLDELCETVGDLDRKQKSLIKVVYCDLEDEESIKPAIGNASRVICAVGAAESEFTNLSAPKRIDYEATETLIDVAAECDIPQFILVTSLGTGKLGFPAGVLNLFGGILIWKRKAEEALERSGMPYLIVRPGGMERPKDDHKLTHNVALSGRDKLFGGTVSRLQIAELIVSSVISPEAAVNKCVEVVAETEAPLRNYDELLDEMPVEVEQGLREQALASIQELRLKENELADTLEMLKDDLISTRESIAAVQESLSAARKTAKEIRKDNIDSIRDAEALEAEVC